MYTATHANVRITAAANREAGISEDDPRSPCVIASKVGDVAGMGADIFESYCGATIAIASTMALAAADALGGREMLMGLPLHLGSLGLLCRIGGVVPVSRASGKSPEKAPHTGTLGASALFIAAAIRGAWDDARIGVEKGNPGDKGSGVHKATVVRDTRATGSKTPPVRR